MKQTIYVPDIECDSCVRLISKKLQKNNITRFSTTSESVILEDNQHTSKVINLIQDVGFRASTEPFERKTFKERIRHYKENKQKYTLERLGVQYFFTLLVLLAGLFTLTYFILFQHQENFLTSYGWWIGYLIISVVSIAIATWHYTAYQGKITCMTGMMIGMTFGMQTGMMIGAVIGATNGFFWGSLVGVVLGTTIGILTGNCCGIMGIMEGAMAGLMGGTMGPMITVMMFSDNLLWFMPVYMIINLFIMAGLSYMLYEEVVEGKTVKTNPLDATTLFTLTIIVTVLLALLMIYGPSSALLSFR